MAQIKVTSHKDEVLKAKDEAIEKALTMIGLEAEGYAKLNAPVDTGRLRNSINWSTSTARGGGGDRDEPKGTPEAESVYIGTNVEYAEYQELGDFKHKTGRSPYLKPAINDHLSEYEKIAKACLDGKV